MKNEAVIFFITMAVFFAGIQAVMGDNDREMQRLEYCEMVQLHKQTNGHYGWPDYRGNAGEVCK